MSKTLFKSDTILQPRDDASPVEVAQGVLLELKTMHPEWTGTEYIRWSVKLKELPDKTARLQLRVTDPTAPPKGLIVRICVLVAIVLSWGFFLQGGVLNTREAMLASISSLTGAVVTRLYLYFTRDRS